MAIPSDPLNRWLDAINQHDVEALAALMTEDHVFIDSLGLRAASAKSMESGWRAYFAMCPDYWVRLDDVMTEGARLLAAGEAGGTIDGQAFRMPAAWLAVIPDARIAEWRVFADNKPVYDILARRVR